MSGIMYTFPTLAQENGESLHQGIHQSVFMSAMVPSTPSRDLPLNWDQHSKLLPGVDTHQAQDVAQWTSDEVAQFVEMLPGCEELARLFEEEVSADNGYYWYHEMIF